MVTASPSSESSTRVTQFRYVRYVGGLCVHMVIGPYPYRVGLCSITVRPLSGELRQRILLFPRQIMLLKDENLWQTGIMSCLSYQ